MFLIKHKHVRQKTKTLKHWKSTETVLNQKIPIAKSSVTRQLLKSYQLGTFILFAIANEHNCFKIQFSVCIDNFEQYFDTSLPITLNDLKTFVNNSKSVHSFEK